MLTFHDHAEPGLGPVRRRGGDAHPHRPADPRLPRPGRAGRARPTIHRNPTRPAPGPPDGPARSTSPTRPPPRGPSTSWAPAIRDRLIVEDPDRPLPEDAVAEGTARIVVDQPERVEVEVDARTPAYLVLADTFDPGWSATLDGRPAPIRPAFAAFRAVFVEPGPHRVVFTYEPAGFRVGLVVTVAGPDRRPRLPGLAPAGRRARPLARPAGLAPALAAGLRRAPAGVRRWARPSRSARAGSGSTPDGRGRSTASPGPPGSRRSSR